MIRLEFSFIMMDEGAQQEAVVRQCYVEVR